MVVQWHEGGMSRNEQSGDRCGQHLQQDGRCLGSASKLLSCYFFPYATPLTDRPGQWRSGSAWRIRASCGLNRTRPFSCLFTPSQCVGALLAGGCFSLSVLKHSDGHCAATKNMFTPQRIVRKYAASQSNSKPLNSHCNAAVELLSRGGERADALFVHFALEAGDQGPDDDQEEGQGHQGRLAGKLCKRTLACECDVVSRAAHAWS